MAKPITVGYLFNFDGPITMGYHRCKFWASVEEIVRIFYKVCIFVYGYLEEKKSVLNAFLLFVLVICRECNE